MDKEDEVLPVEKKWGRLLHDHPYGPCPELEALEEIAEKGARAARYEERMQHVVSCGNCREIIDQLRLLNTQWQPVSERTAQAHERFSLHRLLHSVRSPGFALGAGLAAILLVIIFFDRAHIAADRLQRTQLEQQLAESKQGILQVRQEKARSDEQASARIAEMQEQLQAAKNRPPLLLVPDDKRLVKLALNQPNIRIPEGYDVVRGSAPSLRPLPKYPSLLIIRDLRPTFEWNLAPDAVDYQVTLTPYSGSGANVHYNERGRLQSPWQRANIWRPIDSRGKPITLRPGQKYAWQVAWRTKSLPADKSALAAFETIDAPSEERLENAELANGIQQAQAGQLDDAEKAFQHVLAINPKNSAARKLIATLQKKRAAALPAH
jgi:hypothetical protein